ncbi:iron-containing alcohol dehydrogenase [Paracholeplasma manati]|uniref:iron-containing alcohol dehydrogenase n=1 Tax=Paracholeplasma manati TaxID=591373 RepID=UPI002407D454|nr:iron-containing alcohol dehydrogenase [Paracholeplasma manati]MDG0889571.1 iron-containing alcohol dehydrogenase [Paracholeplasma manati]
MKVLFRIVQFVLKWVSKVLPWKQPIVLEGPDSLLLLKKQLTTLPYKHYLIVTDKGIQKAGLLEEVLKVIQMDSIQFTIFDETPANPTVQAIEKAYEQYLSMGCDALIALGGGSAIDAAKAVGIRVIKPNTPLHKMKGILKVRKKLPYLIAIPTTAGTGSETTIATVISNPDTHEKYAISDLNIMPKVAVLEPKLIKNLPKFFTATTGMDALTHAVEAYIGHGGTKYTNKMAEEAILGIQKHLKNSVDEPHDLVARAGMLKASFQAGAAFTRAYVGNIHAIAHTFGGFYQVPHGYANAIIMPHVLKFYGKTAESKLAKLSDLLKLTDTNVSNGMKMKAFIDWIEKLNAYFGIPTQIEVPHKQDVEAMIRNAYKESNPLYPVPKILSKMDFKVLYNAIMKVEPKAE